MAGEKNQINKTKTSMLYAMTIEWRNSVDQKKNATLNNIQIRALLAGLSSHYEEACIWSTSNHVTVWVVGNQPEILHLAFQHYRYNINKTQLYLDWDAKQLLQKILNGKIWKHDGLSDKLFQLAEAKALAEEAGSIGPVLRELVDQAIHEFTTQPEMWGMKNGWRVMAPSLKKINIEMPPIFYRYSLN